MSEQDLKPGRTDDYVFVPARSIDDAGLIRFAAAVWPDRPPHDRILASWWRRADDASATAAVHKPTGAMAGICGGRACEWIIDGQRVPSVAICDWYVAPEHAGKGLGKRLVQHYEAPGRFLYAFSISDAAIANFQKLGWTGPYRSAFMVLPLPRMVGLPLSWLGEADGLKLEQHERAGGQPLAALGPVLDRIEAARVRDPQAHMCRGAKDWEWRLSVCGDRSYRFSVAYRGDQPLGYVTVRRMTPGSSRQLGNLPAAIVPDLVAVNDDPAVLRALARRAVAMAAELGVSVAIVTTTVAAQQGALARAGFISPGFPVLGRVLERRAAQYMWVPQGPGADLRADAMALTFADVAVDLDL